MSQSVSIVTRVEVLQCNGLRVESHLQAHPHAHTHTRTHTHTHTHTHTQTHTHAHTQVNESPVWSELGHAQLKSGQVAEAIASYLLAQDSSNYLEVSI